MVLGWALMLLTNELLNPPIFACLERACAELHFQKRAGGET
jgi:hypothetical protein